MKVRCKKLVDSLGNPQIRSAWLTVGKVYHVLSVLLDAQGEWLLRLMADSDPGVGLYPLRQFDIVSEKIPDSWIVSWNKEGVFELTTDAWNQPGYWERYFERDASAMSAFNREMKRIVAADP